MVDLESRDQLAGISSRGEATASSLASEGRGEQTNVGQAFSVGNESTSQAVASDLALQQLSPEDQPPAGNDDEPPQSEQRLSSKSMKALNSRVLVIDDEPLLAQTIQLGLDDSFDVEIAGDGLSGLDRILADEFWGLILCDLSLPDISGAEVYRRALATRPEIKERFVIMTGGAVTLEAREFMSSYTGAVLSKPFSLSELEELVQGRCSG
ncbi:MAG: response regulator [Polyangiaceae bacterium]|nr:response regulator [Polyangiaceae bacterium]